MARTLTPKDVHSLVNLLVKQITGQQFITVTDASSFVSAGELILNAGMENVYNALNILLNRTIIAARPYNAKLKMIQAENESAFASRMRKISYYSKDALPSGAFNTDLYTNFADGYTSGDNSESSTKSQWEQHPAMPLEMNFAGVSTWQDCITMYEDAVKYAFTSEEEFARFVSGYLTEHGNDIESQKEAWNRLAILNKIASVYDMSDYMPGSVINLTESFNSRFGTQYTSAQLRSTYLKEFLAFFVATFKTMSRRMTNRSASKHWPVTKTVGDNTYSILRHTPYRDQRVILYGPLYTEAEAMVLPEIFRPEYLDIDTQFEEVDFWQNERSSAAINVTPAINDPNRGIQMAGATVSIPYVVGMLFDKDALMTSYSLETVSTTPLEARKRYRNTWNTFARNIISDNTENSVIFIMEDETPGGGTD